MAAAGCQVGKAKEHVRLVFVGSPLLDITSECDQTTLDTYQLRPDNCVRSTGAHDRLFLQLLDSPGRRLDSGGSALNSAKIAKWVLGERGSVSFAGCVGDDDFASLLRRSLQDSGVEPILVSFRGQQTGVCACLLSPGGGRSLVTRHGASALFSADHLQEEAISRRLEAADCIFVVGYFLAHSPDVVRGLAERCTSSQLFSLSLSAEYICREYADILLDILPRVDILVGNEAEIRALAKAAAFEETLTIENCVRAIAKLRSSNSGCRTVVVTRGAEPVILLEENHPLRHFCVPQNVDVVDSVGCGDALAGALLATYVLTGDLGLAVQSGIQAAVKIVQSPGCDPPSGKLCV